MESSSDVLYLARASKSGTWYPSAGSRNTRLSPSSTDHQVTGSDRRRSLATCLVGAGSSLIALVTLACARRTTTACRCANPPHTIISVSRYRLTVPAQDPSFELCAIYTRVASRAPASRATPRIAGRGSLRQVHRQPVHSSRHIFVARAGQRTAGACRAANTDSLSDLQGAPMGVLELRLTANSPISAGRHIISC